VGGGLLDSLGGEPTVGHSDGGQAGSVARFDIEVCVAHHHTGGSPELSSQPFESSGFVGAPVITSGDGLELVKEPFLLEACDDVRCGGGGDNDEAMIGAECADQVPHAFKEWGVPIVEGMRVGLIDFVILLLRKSHLGEIDLPIRLVPRAKLLGGLDRENLVVRLAGLLKDLKIER